MGKRRWPQYGSARYKRARAALLESNPSCHWCGAAATTADHEPPIDVVGSWHWGLVPACAPCNFGRRNGTPNAALTGSPSRVWL